MKKQYLLILFLFTYLYISAQLTVRQGNYLYANDIVVFVNDDVNIVGTTSHIYLRNGAQLIQGTGTTGNSGRGMLSVYQYGNASAASYNYWCSPVGNTLANNNLNRPFRADNNIYDVDISNPPIASSLASYANAPVYNGTSNPLVIASYWLFTYDPGTEYSAWDQVLQTGGVTTGYGFTMKGTLGSGNNQLYDFRGKPNNGTIPTAVLNGQETLVGNPYPSALDARDYIHDTINSSLLDSATLYFWEQDLTTTSHVIINYRGGYATYTINSDGTVETFIPATFDSYNFDGTLNTVGSSSSSGKQVYRYIPIGQGFMVRGSGNGNLRVTNSMREYVKEAPSISEFFRISNANNSTTTDDGIPEHTINYNDNGLQILPSDYKRFRLNIDFDETYTRQLVQNFHHTATYGKDYGLESRSPELIESDAHWIQDGEPYSAQAFSFSEDLTIPLTINIDHQQLIRVRIFDVQHFDISQPIFLHDIEAGTYTNLRVQNYESILEPGNYTERFEITFVSEALSTTEVTEDAFTVYQNNQLAQLTIKNPNGLDVKQINLYDIQGKLLLNQLDLAQSNEFTFSTKNFSDGTYIVNISLASGESVSKKVVIFNK